MSAGLPCEKSAIFSVVIIPVINGIPSNNDLKLFVGYHEVKGSGEDRARAKIEEWRAAKFCGAVQYEVSYLNGKAVEGVIGINENLPPLDNANPVYCYREADLLPISS